MNPSYLRFLAGALAGSACGGLLWQLAYGEFTYPAGLAIASFIGGFIFVFFLVLGTPLFFAARGTKWFSAWVAGPVGGGVGALATVLFGGPDTSWATIGFALVGTATALIGYAVMKSSNKRFQGDGLASRDRA